MLSLNLRNLFPDKKHSVGLDIGSSSLKLVEILDSPEGYVLKSYSQLPLERGVIEEGDIMNGDVLSGKIRQLFNTAGCTSQKVAVSLSGHKVIARRAVFSTMEEEELRQLINDEAANYLPFDDVKDVSFDFQILGDSEGNPGHMDVMIVAARKNVVQSYVDVLEKAGLAPVIMDVDSFALETMYEVNYDVQEGDIVVLVNIGASMTNINILKEGCSIFTRDISLGGDYITESIRDRFGVTLEEAEKLKIESSRTDSPAGGPRVDPLEHAEPLFAEIERSIDYFRSTHGGEYIKEIILSGGSAKTAGIVDALAQRLNVEARIVRPFQSIVCDEKTFRLSYLEEIGPVAAVGVGLGLRRIDDR